MPHNPESVSFDGATAPLSGILHVPDGNAKAGVVLAHCFTCSKTYKIVRHLADGIAKAGYAVLRFDFTGLGESDGDFSQTSVTTNVEDIEAAARYMRQRGYDSCALIGHSLGGSAALLAAHRMKDICAVGVIAAPATAGHVKSKFSRTDVDSALESGKVEVEIAGRPFFISAEFFRDLERHNTLDHVTFLDRPVLVVHSPSDRIVGIEEGEKIFMAARQPRWFVSIPGANHLFSDAEHASMVVGAVTGFLKAVLQATPGSPVR